MNIRIKTMRLLYLCPIVFLSGCGGGSPDSDLSKLDKTIELADIAPVEICNGFFNQDDIEITIDTSACTGCEVLNPEAAIDGDFDTVATISIANTIADSSGAITFTVSSTTGTLRETGYAGIFMGTPSPTSFPSETAFSSTTNVQSLRNGTPQQAISNGGARPRATGLEKAEPFVMVGNTSTSAQPYDGIQLAFSWQSGAPLRLHVSEFCSASDFLQGIHPPAPPARAPASQPSVASTNDDGLYEIDLLMLYSPRYASIAGSDVAASDKIAALVQSANELYWENDIPVKYRIVDTALYSGVSETLDPPRSLDFLVADPKVAEYRDQVGADVVSLILSNDLSVEVCGIATLFNDGLRSTEADNIDRRLDGYMIAAMGDGVFRQACDPETFPHELGHILAGGHESASVPADLYWKPYSHAFQCGRNEDDSLKNTLMWNHSGNPGPVFSSPNVLQDGDVCGNADTEDNDRAIREAAPYVSAYR